jgi:hypothetical protein
VTLPGNRQGPGVTEALWVRLIETFGLAKAVANPESDVVSRIGMTWILTAQQDAED